jgi:hypothetical protein
MGLGTPYRESLSSYYLALAHLHNLSPKNLARGIIIPRMVGNVRRGEDTFSLWKWPLFNGIGTVPETWATQLSALTGQQNLIDLTLVPLRPYTNVQRLMSDIKKWCPLCLSEAVQEGRIYGQLLWEIDAVQACPKHGIKLVNTCRCKRSAPLPSLNIKHLTGFCDSCGHSLIQNNDEFIEKASADVVTRVQLVANLLGDVKRLKHNTGATVGISGFLKGAVEHFTEGNAAYFGRLLGIRKNTLHGWMHGKCIPTFPQLIEIAVACQCSIADIMLGHPGTFKEPYLINPHSAPRKSCRTRRPQKLDKELLKSQLKMLAAAEPPISAATAAAKIGVSRRTLSRNFGNIARKITQRFRAHKHSESIYKFADRCDLYRQSAKKLLQQGIRPTRRLVGLDIKGKGIVGKGEEQAACSRICLEVIEKSQGTQSLLCS